MEDAESEENNGMNKENVTERLAAVRQTKFNQLWDELISKISQLNQVILLLIITDSERVVLLGFTQRITRD